MFQLSEVYLVRGEFQQKPESFHKIQNFEDINKLNIPIDSCRIIPFSSEFFHPTVEGIHPLFPVDEVGGRLSGLLDVPRGSYAILSNILDLGKQTGARSGLQGGCSSLLTSLFSQKLGHRASCVGRGILGPARVSFGTGLS